MNAENQGRQGRRHRRLAGPTQEQKEHAHRPEMEQEVVQLEETGVPGGQLPVEHVRQPRERMPVGFVVSEGPAEAFPREAAPNARAKVGGIVVAQERVVGGLQIGHCHEAQHKGKTLPVPRAGSGRNSVVVIHDRALGGRRGGTIIRMPG